MSLDLNLVLPIVGALEDLVIDVKKGIDAGGGVVAESVAVVEALLLDADFKAKLVAIVDGLKGKS